MQEVLRNIEGAFPVSDFVKGSRRLVRLLAGHRETLDEEVRQEKSFAGKCIIKLLFAYNEEALKVPNEYHKFVLALYKESESGSGNQPETPVTEGLRLMAWQADRS